MDSSIRLGYKDLLEMYNYLLDDFERKRREGYTATRHDIEVHFTSVGQIQGKLEAISEVLGLSDTEIRRRIEMGQLEERLERLRQTTPKAD